MDKLKTGILYGLFVTTTALLLLTLWTAVEINNAVVYYILLFTSVSLGTILLGSRIFKMAGNGFRLVVLVLVGLTCAAMHFLTWGGDWKTQEIIYQNLHLSTRTVEFQMKSVGALGWRDRTVERVRLVPFVDWIHRVDPKKIDSLTWKKVNIDVNELGLK